MDPAVRPTKVDRASDVTGLVDTGELGTLFQNTDDAVAVLESMTRLGHVKVTKSNTLVADETAIKGLVKCGYVKSTYLADQFRDKAALNPDIDPMIVGPAGIFTQAEYSADNEFRKTAAVMKMVISGFAGAGTITMGGYDYHGQGRDTAETRNFRAGRCIGACLEYAARKNVPVVIYVFSDGSLSANGVINNSALGRGKLDYASDNQSTACPFMLVFNPRGRPTLRDPNRNQVGSFSMAGDVLTASSPAGNAVNLLVETVLLNYMALHGEQANFDQPAFFPRHGLGSVASRDALTIFNPIVNGTVSNPI
jgi:hypothetical protein